MAVAMARQGASIQTMLTEKLGFFFVAAYLFVTDRKTSASAAVTETSLLWAEVLKKFPSA
jgi:hypothetical protein